MMIFANILTHNKVISTLFSLCFCSGNFTSQVYMSYSPESKLKNIKKEYYIICALWYYGIHISMHHSYPHLKNGVHIKGQMCEAKLTKYVNIVKEFMNPPQIIYKRKHLIINMFWFYFGCTIYTIHQTSI